MIFTSPECFIVAVAGNAHEVDKGVPLHGARKIGQEETGAFQDTNQVERTVGVIDIDLGPDFGDAGVDLFFGNEGLEGHGVGDFLLSKASLARGEGRTVTTSEESDQLVSDITRRGLARLAAEQNSRG